jgi:predicted ATPase
VVVTSRERLQLQGEQVYPVPTLTEDDGIELFLARARALEPDVDANGSAAELCARLDNLPLALELAAARTTLFSAEQLVARLSQRLDLLEGGRDADPRQQTLRATIEWSYDLLSPSEQRLFRSLSVFAGGCSYDAAEAVCDAGPDSLHSLIDKSLLRRRDSELGSRYWMLETIREYAAERLEDAADACALRRRHAEWCCKLAEQSPTTPDGTALGSDIEEHFARLQEERGNLQRALAWAWTTGHDELGLRLGVALRRFWVVRGGFHEATAWLRAAEPRIATAPRSLQAPALRSAGQIAFFVLAETEKADAYWTAALGIAEDLGQVDEIERVEMLQAAAVWERGDLERALRLAKRGVEKYHASGNRSSEATWLHGLGEILRDLGRFEEAERALLKADSIAVEIGEHERFVAANTHSLGDLALDRGDLDAALELYRQSVDIPIRPRSPAHMAACLAGIASVLAERKHDDVAATIWGAVCAAEETSGFRMLKVERRRYEQRLGRLERTSAWKTGKKITLEDALTSVSSQ